MEETTMNTPAFSLPILFFVISCFTSCFICIYLVLTCKRMESKLNHTISFMQWVKARHDTTHMYTLHRLLEILIRQERYEEAEKVKKMIEQEMKDLEDGNL